MNNLLRETLLLWSSWVAASIFAVAGLTTLFFGYEAACLITNCGFLELYPPAESKSNYEFQQVVKEAFHNNWWEPPMTAGLYFSLWLALGYFVFSNRRRAGILVVFLHVIVIIYAFLALVIFGGLSARDTNVPLIFLVPPLIGFVASVFYLILREYFLRVHQDLKSKVDRVKTEINDLIHYLRQIYVLNERLQTETPIELVIGTGDNSRAVINNLQRVLQQDTRSTLMNDDPSDDKPTVVQALFFSQVAIRNLLRVHPGRVQKLKNEYGLVRNLERDLTYLQTWVQDTKNDITKSSTALAVGVTKASKEILKSHEKISYDEFLRNFLEAELSMRLDKRIPSIDPDDFPWSVVRTSSQYESDEE